MALILFILKEIMFDGSMSNVHIVDQFVLDEL